VDTIPWGGGVLFGCKTHVTPPIPKSAVNHVPELLYSSSYPQLTFQVSRNVPMKVLYLVPFSSYTLYETDTASRGYYSAKSEQFIIAEVKTQHT
jgi:hypothetical protein